MSALNVIYHSFNTLASLVNNTLTNLTQTTIYLPENTKTFRKVIAHITCDDIVTATGGSLTTKNFGLRLGAAAYTTVSNANTLSNSGENASFGFAVDFTSHFTANWSGSSMTCDFQLQINQSTGTTLGMVNVCVTLEIMYEYDETTSTTRIKTVQLPLNAPLGALTTTDTTYDTISNLSTRLGEESKVFRNIYVELQGNEARNTAVTDHTVKIVVGSNNVVTGNYEGSLASDRWFRYIYDVSSVINTADTQIFQLSDTVGRNNHLQAKLYVTYEYNASTTTTVEQSLMLPVKASAGFAGGTVAGDAVRLTVVLYVEEPATITTREIAFYSQWTQAGAIAGLNMRMGASAYSAYTDTASVLCGGCGAMLRDDTAFTLVRGKNTLTLDVYRTDTADFTWAMSGYFLINYTSGKSSQGIEKHNKTIPWNLGVQGTAAQQQVWTSPSEAPIIPETNYFLNHVGVKTAIQGSAAVVPNNYSLTARINSGEGAQNWYGADAIIQQQDTETGIYTHFQDFNGFFKQWPADVREGRYDIETARNWRLSSQGNFMMESLKLLITYHGITFTTTDGATSAQVTDSSGGTVDISLHRKSDGLKVASTTRTGNGNYELTYYDNTENMQVVMDEVAANKHTASDFGTLYGSP